MKDFKKFILLLLLLYINFIFNHIFLNFLSLLLTEITLMMMMIDDSDYDDDDDDDELDNMLGQFRLEFCILYQNILNI